MVFSAENKSDSLTENISKAMLRPTDSVFHLFTSQDFIIIIGG